MPLSDQAAKKAKPADKPYKLADEKALYLLVNAAGKYWRMNYRHDGKRKTLALGVYPDVSLARAREKRDEARSLLADGIDPSDAALAKRAPASPDLWRTAAQACDLARIGKPAGMRNSCWAFRQEIHGQRRCEWRTIRVRQGRGGLIIRHNGKRPARCHPSRAFLWADLACVGAVFSFSEQAAQC